MQSRWIQGDCRIKRLFVYKKSDRQNLIFPIYCLRKFDTDLKVTLNFLKNSIIKHLHTPLYFKFEDKVPQYAKLIVFDETGMWSKVTMRGSAKGLVSHWSDRQN